MNRDQIATAVNTGLELLGPESTISIPAKLNDGVFLLKQLLTAIAQGRVGLSTPPSADGKAPAAPPAPNRQQRRAAAKVSKKVSKKKA